MKITVFGSGYVGLVTGACLADGGHQVRVVDSDMDKVNQLTAGKIPIYEPGLEDIVKRNIKDRRLDFTTNGESGVGFADLIFIAVGTPSTDAGHADLSFVMAVAKTIGLNMNSDKIVVNKSTVPVGTAEAVQKEIQIQLRKRNLNLSVEVCSNPEFLKEGTAIEDFTKGPRIIVGTKSDEVKSTLRECYAPYNRNHEKIIFMETRAAELTKYAANAMLATKISFMNEMANLAEKLGVDIEQVRQGIGSDPRIGYHFIYAGCGYGGSCFPKDVSAMIHFAEESSSQMRVLKAVSEANNSQKKVLFHKLAAIFSSNLSDKTIAVWGLSFKPGTDDLREAPSVYLVNDLLKAGAKIRVYDPVVNEKFLQLFEGNRQISLTTSQEDAVEGADALAICTEWKQFRTVDFNWLKSKLKAHVVVDGRNIWNPAEVKKAGINYFGIGRGDKIS